jgi:hypothetical protein
MHILKTKLKHMIFTFFNVSYKNNKLFFMYINPMYDLIFILNFFLYIISNFQAKVII